MEISVIVQIEQEKIWTITFDSQNNCPIKGNSTRSKGELRQVINALDVAKEQVQAQVLAANNID